MFSGRTVLVCSCLVLSGAAFARQASSPNPAGTPSQAPKSAASAQLTNLFDSKIHAEWDAIKKRDKKALGELLDDDYIAVEADRSGERFKWQVLSELDHSSVTDFTLSLLKVTPLGPDAAFVRYEVFMRFPPGSLQRFLKVLVGEVWVRRGGRWKALHYQETAVK